MGQTGVTEEQTVLVRCCDVCGWAGADCNCPGGPQRLALPAPRVPAPPLPADLTELGVWGPGRCSSSVVSTRPAPDALRGADDTAYYGGYLVAESVPPSLVPLLAAAPDLLAACEAVVTADDYEGIGPFKEQLRAAIAKARGKGAVTP